MKNLILSVALFALAGLPASHAHEGHDHPAGHLKFADGLYHVHLDWTAGPLVSDESVLHLEFRDGATHAVIAAPAAFRVWLNMPDMEEHETPDTVITPVTDDKGAEVPGVFTVASIYFIMPGHWNVNVSLLNPDGTEETQAWNVEVGGEHGGHDAPHAH